MPVSGCPDPPVDSPIAISYTDVLGRRQDATARVTAVGRGTWTLTSPGGAPLPIHAEVTLAFQVGHQTLCGLGRVVRTTPDLVVARPAHLEATTRRRAYRVHTRIPADTALGPGELRELSAAGGLLALPGPRVPPPGTQLHLDLHLTPPHAPLPLRASVQRVVQAGPRVVLLAVAFESMLERHRNAIARYVSEQERALLKERRAGAD